MMAGDDPFARLRIDHGSIRTPVDEVMIRGRQIRHRRHVRNTSLAGATTVAAIVGLVLGFGGFNGGGGGNTHVVASPGVSVGDVAVPIVGRCVSGSASAVNGTGPVVDASALPAGLKVTSTSDTSVANCAVPPIALVFSVSSAPQTAAVALWGPGAVPTLDPNDGIVRPSASSSTSTDVHGQAARLTVTGTNGEVSWREANGTSWVLVGHGIASTELVRLANAINVDSGQKATLPDPASFGLKAEAPEVFPAAGGTATIWSTQYEGGGNRLAVTIVDNGVRSLGTLALAAPVSDDASLTTVRGHQAFLESAADGAAVTWAESPTRTITVNGTYSPAQLVAIAEGLVIR